MSATDAVEVIELAKNVTRGAALAMFGIAVILAFIFVLVTSPEEKIIDLISDALLGAIIMLGAHVSLLFLYHYAKDEERETVKDDDDDV